MGKTMTEKIFAKASHSGSVTAGDFVRAKVHAVCLTDTYASGLEIFDERKVWDPSRILFAFDHFYHESVRNGGAPIQHAKTRAFARRQGIPLENVYDVGRHGNSHQVPAEHGWVVPGVVYIARDTQGATMGAFNCFAMAALAEAPDIMATGDVWMIVPKAMRIDLVGTPRKGILGKDIGLTLLNDLKGSVGGQVIEVAGPGLSGLSVDARMAIASSANHLDALSMVFAADDLLIRYVAPRAGYSVNIR